MRPVIPILVVFIFVSLITTSCEQMTEEPKYSDQYIDSVKPTDSALIFSRGFISRYMAERDVAFSPDGSEFYYSIWLPNRKGVVMKSRFEKEVWSTPQPAFFSGRYSDIEPAFSPDGNRLYFASNRPVMDSINQGYDIWYTEKVNGLWAEPVNAGFPVNTEVDEFYPSLAINNNIYLTRGYGNQEKIVCCRYNDSIWMEAEILSDSVNASHFQFNAFIDPDEEFLIYSSVGRGDGYGGGDLYINYRDSLGSWGKAYNLGDKINTPFLDYCPYVAPDGDFFFFTSGKINDTINNNPVSTLDDLDLLFHANENGHSDLYWISTKVLEGLNK